jgi:DNA-binding XRE family transcriptional regulator
MNSSHMAERAGGSSRALLSQYGARTGLSLAQLAARASVQPRTVRAWEAGSKDPSVEDLQRLIAVLLDAGGLRAGAEVEEAHDLWAVRGARTAASAQAAGSSLASAAAERRATAPGVTSGQDWGEAPDVANVVGRAKELTVLRGWLLDERCRLVAVVGTAGIGKTSLATRLAREMACTFESVYWRSLRDAPLSGDWLAGAIGFLSDQQRVPPVADAERIAALLQLLREGAQRSCLVLTSRESRSLPGQLGRWHLRGHAAAVGRADRALLGC